MPLLSWYHVRECSVGPFKVSASRDDIDGTYYLTIYVKLWRLSASCDVGWENPTH